MHTHAYVVLKRKAKFLYFMKIMKSFLQCYNGSHYWSDPRSCLFCHQVMKRRSINLPRWRWEKSRKKVLSTQNGKKAFHLGFFCCFGFLLGRGGGGGGGGGGGSCSQDLPLLTLFSFFMLFNHHGLYDCVETCSQRAGSLINPFEQQGSVKYSSASFFFWQFYLSSVRYACVFCNCFRGLLRTVKYGGLI